MGTGWRPSVRELRESAVVEMREIVGSPRDPLKFCCELAADEQRDIQLRLSAASIALPYLYPKLSATQVSATHTVHRVDPAQLIDRLNQQLERLGAPQRLLQAEPAK